MRKKRGKSPGTAEMEIKRRWTELEYQKLRAGCRGPTERRDRGREEQGEGPEVV